MMHTLALSGHQSLSESTKVMVAAALADILSRLSGSFVGMSSLAEGSDQLFAEAVLRQGGDLTAVIPCAKYEETFGTAQAKTRYGALLRKATKTIVLNNVEPSEEAFWAAGKYIVENSDGLVAVWDGKPAGGLGGTADVVAYARRLGRPVTIIWPNGSSRS